MHIFKYSRDKSKANSLTSFCGQCLDKMNDGVLVHGLQTNRMPRSRPPQWTGCYRDAPPMLRTHPGRVEPLDSATTLTMLSVNLLQPWRQNHCSLQQYKRTHTHTSQHYPAIHGHVRILTHNTTIDRYVFARMAVCDPDDWTHELRKSPKCLIVTLICNFWPHNLISSIFVPTAPNLIFAALCGHLQ